MESADTQSEPEQVDQDDAFVEDVEDDPAYEPDDERLKDIKGG